MDWFSWLSRTNLEASLIYEYGLSFSHNELEYEDIAYFNHEFLQSIGISIAKHRLEILKLARRDRKSSPLTALSILSSIRKTGKCFSEYLRAWIRREKRSSSLSQALVVVPGDGRWKNALLKRNKRWVVMPSNGNGGFGSDGKKQERLVLTNNGNGIDRFFTNPMVHEYDLKKEKLCNDDDDTYWGKDVEEIKWDSMFQNLKPT